MGTNFYSDTKWCPECQAYVMYMMSVNHSYCVGCGCKVRLFNKEDSERFGDEVKKRKWRAV